MRISDWSSDVCSSDLGRGRPRRGQRAVRALLPDARRRQPALSADRHRHRHHAVPGNAAAAGKADGAARRGGGAAAGRARSEEHTSELQSLMRTSYAVFCLKKKKTTQKQTSSTIVK